MSEPVAYSDGKISLSSQWTSSAPFQKAIPVMTMERDKLKDVHSWLFFTRNPRSLYANFPDEDKMRLLLRDKRIADPAWLLKVIEEPEVAHLRDEYARMVLSPAERLRIGMLNRIHEFLEEMSSSTGDDIASKVALGEKLLQSTERLEAMAVKERKRVRAGYKRRYFETRPSG